MNVRLSVSTAVFLLLAARSAWSQPALDRVEKQLRNQTPARTPAAAGGHQPGYLGVVADDRQSDGRGITIVDVTPGGPAAAAGLQVGDVLVAIDSQPVKQVDDMTRLLEPRAAGATVPFQIERQGAARTLRVTLGERPAPDRRRLPKFGKQPEDLPAPGTAKPGAPQPAVPQAGVPQPGAPEPAAPQPGPPPAAIVPNDGLLLVPAAPKLGVRTVAISDALRQQYNLPSTQGALITGVTVGLPAEQAGVPVGAAITAVDGQPIESPQALATLVRQMVPGQVLEVSYNFRGAEATRRLTLPPAAAGQREVRAKPVPAAEPLLVDPAPLLQPPGFEPQGGVSARENDRIEMLLQRVAELEARVAKLEAALAEQPAE